MESGSAYNLPLGDIADLVQELLSHRRGIKFVITTVGLDWTEVILQAV